MRALHVLILVAACQSSSRPSPVARASVETLSTNARRTTTEGATFIAPAGWALTVRGPATILEAPERGSWIALVDVHAPDADAAVERAWAAYRPPSAMEAEAREPAARPRRLGRLQAI
jgi:hypothetical protein